MNLIDLHVHSNISDGTLSPSELVDMAVRKKLAAFALTDHDTVFGIDEALSAAEEYKKEGIDIEVVPGTELSADYNGTDIHILGYYIDYQDNKFKRMLDSSMEEREIRNSKMVHRLAAAGIDITMEKLVSSSKNAVLTRAHFAQYLMEHHYVKSMKDAFIKFLSKDGPYYVPRKYMAPKKAISSIRAAGGISVLAHPLLYHFSNEELDSLLKYLKSQGLIGIETFYPANTGFDEGHVRGLALKYNLLMTGGSDYHGSIKPSIEMGTGKGNLKVPYSVLEDMKKLLPVK